MGYLDERAAAALKASAPQTKAADYDRFWDETLTQARALLNNYPGSVMEEVKI